MHYPGDILVFVLSLQAEDGTAPTVSGTPTCTVINALTGTPLTSPALSLTAVSGTAGLYSGSWNSAGAPQGLYLALVSYATNTETVNGKLLTTIQLGDTYVTGRVALDATVAKDVSVAKAAYTLQKADYVPPDQSTLLQNISTGLSALASNLPSLSLFNQLLQSVGNLSDFLFGNWTINKQTNEMIYFRENGAQLKKYLLSNSANESSRLQQQ